MSPRRSIIPVALVGALGVLSACGPNADTHVSAGGIATTAPVVTAVEPAPEPSAMTTVENAASATVTDGAALARSAPDEPIDAHDSVPMSRPATVAVIGDSIALSAQSTVTDSLRSLGMDVVAYDAVESRRMVSGSSALPSGQSAIEGVLDSGATPELWIVALGTNDVGAGASEADARADIERLERLIPDDAALVWVDTWMRDRNDDAVALNAWLRQELLARPNTWVLDWHDHGPVDGLIIQDGIHLTEVGKREYARMIGDALRTIYPEH